MNFVFGSSTLESPICTDQQINRSTDQQINRSTDQQINRSTDQLLYGLIVLTMLTGCKESSLATDFSKDTTRVATHNSSISIDAGVVLADRDGYICMPFEQCGLSTDARIELIHSSCDCVAPSSVMYLTTSGKKAGAILLRYVADSTMPDAVTTNPNGMSLGVVINVRLEDGTNYPLKLQMIRSLLADEGLQ